MATIHLLDGEKGGVGKSFIAKTMIQYCREYKGFGILGKQRVVNFLKAAYSSFDSTGVWKDESSTA